MHKDDHEHIKERELPSPPPEAQEHPKVRSIRKQWQAGKADADEEPTQPACVRKKPSACMRGKVSERGKSKLKQIWVPTLTLRRNIAGSWSGSEQRPP